MNKNSSSGSPLSVQTIVLAAIAWAIASLLFFLLFSVPLPGQGRPDWYGITTYVLENVAFLGAALLCFRNWRSSQIVSGRTVWLAIGLGMVSYFVANLLLAYWELGLRLEPDVSPADFFFILTYLFLGWGMLLAVLSRRLSLTPLQWMVVVGITAGSIALSYLMLSSAPEEEAAEPAIVPVARVQWVSLGSPAPNATIAQSPDAIPPAPPLEETVESSTPGWAIVLDEQLAPLADIIALLYVVGDIILVMMATTLLLAFWGGRFSTSWRFIAAAAFFFYVADLWFLYATSYIDDYQTGALLEVFWIFSGVLFGIGAALEYDLSTRSRRGGRRRA